MTLPADATVLILLGHRADDTQARVVEHGAGLAVPAARPHVLRGPFDGSWWPDDELDHDSWDALVRALDREVEGRGPVVVVGYSQGGAAALAWLASSKRVAVLHGVAGIAAFLPGCVVPPQRVTAAPVLLVAAEDDDVVDPFLVGRAHRLFERAGHAAATVTIPGGHAWSDAATEALRQWVDELR